MNLPLEYDAVYRSSSPALRRGQRGMMVGVIGTTRVHCLRHGESDNVVTGASGALPHAPLTQVGRSQAVTAAQALEPEPITRVYTSTARRARETADILGDELGAEVVEMSGLVEIGIGEKEGATDPVTRARTAEVLRAWVVERDWDARVADGESGRDVVDRVIASFRDIATRHPDGTVALVGHVGSLTAGLVALCEELGSRVWGQPLPHGLPFLVRYERSVWRCPAWPTYPD